MPSEYNQVMVVYEDMTCFVAAWDKIAKLPMGKRYLIVRALRWKDGSQRGITFIGWGDMVYLKGNDMSLFLGERALIPSRSRVSSFHDDESQVVGSPIDPRLDSEYFGNAELTLVTYPFDAFDYNDLTDEAQTKTVADCTVVT